MKFAYKFSNLLGAFYRHGNLSFSKDGNSVISPVGNRISVFDMKNNRSETLPVSTTKNITCFGVSPDGNLAILIDEDGAAILVSLVTRAVLYHHHFHNPVHSVSFSPDGRKFVITKKNVALMYDAPGKNREFNAFALEKSYYGPFDETTCIDWTDDSKCFAVGSKDMTTWIFGAERWANLIYYSLGGHKDIIMGCFFEKDSLDMYTVSQEGTLCVWESDTELEGLRKGPKYSERKKMQEEKKSRDEVGEEKEDDDIVEIVGEDGETRGDVIKGSAETPKEVEGIKNVRYSLRSKHYFNKEGDFNNLTAAAFHKKTHILVTGFASGAFHLHELPEFDLIHSLSISDQRISTIAMNPTGDWIGFGCSGLGQLLVWEWQSESYVFKQQGHFNNMNSLAYSPDGQYLVTGGDDGKVKVWNNNSGLCFVTFTEHSSSVTNVAFTSSGFVVVSASLDGTVRAFDLHRYRNFRTMTSPRPAQFSSLAVDSSGELVCAGSQDSFEIFLWSMQTGRLLEEFLDRRKMTEFGNLSLVDEGTGDGDGIELSLPGVKRGDMSSRRFKPEIRVSSLHFSPTGRSWAAASSEGLLIYSLDASLVFDPYDLDMDVTPSSIQRQVTKKEWASAILLSFRLNEIPLIREVLEAVPYDQITVVCSSLPDVYVDKLLNFVASTLEKSNHLQFYLSWAQCLLTLHGQKLKNRSGAILPTVQQLLKSIQRHSDDLSKLCDWNIYNIRYAAALSKQRGMKRTAAESLSDEESSSEAMDSAGDEENMMNEPIMVEN
ncbi:PWP2 small subunit processome component isoform X3 [Rhinichthys klamathensis goyatoka]|uniref:PWP2 small subunit processome component isoform X3 n=1 Tax=Rhinichthys klamathensis goyatoka TaxID=3034132 RepID=UPI0024B5CAFC|nr:PWP2 small subunit processome component isoform X3 [Rhinichthys klamathensis goyatoka]